MIQVTVRRSREEKRYKLEDLLELQNKLMLMSSKGEHGREQVNRFTEVRGSGLLKKLDKNKMHSVLIEALLLLHFRFLKEFRERGPSFSRCKHLATCSSGSGRLRSTAVRSSSRASSSPSRRWGGNRCRTRER